MNKPSNCWYCGKTGTMQLVKDSHGFKFYQCSHCHTTDNGDAPADDSKKK